MRGAFLDLDTMAPADLDSSPLHAALPRWQMYPLTSPADTLERLRDVEVVVVQKALLDARTLRDASSLRVVCVASTGTNNVDLAAASARRLPVCNVRGYAAGAVPQHVFALVLALVTRLLDYHADVRAGRWQASPTFCLLDHPIRELAGMTLGIVGAGNLGSAVARLGEAFGMTVLLAERPGGGARPGRVPLAELLARADVVTLHCPLADSTRGLIGRRELAAMKPSALLINTARGGLVDEAALAEALRTGTIAGAGIDVLAEEPPVHGSPLLAGDVPHLIVTPHVAWGSREARQRILDEVALNIRAFLDGHPRHDVTATL